MTRGKKTAAWLAGTIIGLGLFTAAIAPTVLSTSWGTQSLTSWLNRDLTGKISIQNLELSWFSGQHLSGLTIRDPQGVEILSVKRADAEVSFFRLLSTCPYVCTTSVEGVSALIVQNSDGTTNFQQALGSTPKPTTTKHRPSSQTTDELSIALPMRGEIKLTQVNVELRSPKLPTVALHDVSATIRSPSHEGPLSIEMKGLSSSANISGSFALTSRLLGFNSAGKLELKSGANGYVTVNPDASIYLKLNLNQLPAATLDYLVALRLPQVEGIITQALGDNLNLNFEQTVDARAMTLNLQAHSPTLDASMDARWSNGTIALAQPGQITFIVTPAFVELLNPSLKLLKPTQAQLQLDRMTLSANGSGAPSARLKLRVDDLKLDGGAQVGPIALSGVHGVLEYLESSQSFLGSLEALLNYNGSSGALRAQGKLANKTAHEADYMITATQLPSILLDRVLQSDGWLNDLIGERFDGQLTYATIGSRGAEIKIDFESEGLSAPNLSLIHRDGMLTAQPETVQLKITPAFARRLMGANKTATVNDGANAVLHLKRLRLPVSDKTTFSWANTQLEAGLDVGAIALNTPKGALRLASARAILTGPSLAQSKFDLRAELASDLDTPFAQAAIGKTASIQLTGTLGTSQEGKSLLLKQANLNWTSELLTMQAAGSIDETGRFSLLEPMVGRYHLSPSILAVLGVHPASTPLLSQPVALDLRLDQLNLSVNDFWNQDLLVQLKAKADLIDLKEGPGENFANLEGVTLALLFDSKQCEAGMTLFGISSQAAKPEKTPFDLDVAVNGWCSQNKWDWADLNVQAHGNLSQFPVKLISALTNKPELVAFLGPTMDLSVNMKRVAKASKAQDPIQISLKAEGIRLDAAFTAGALLKQNPDHPLDLRLELTPTKFDILKKALTALGWNGLERWKLVKDSVITVKGEQWSMPFPNAQKSFGPVSGIVTASFDPLVIKNIDNGKTLAWESLKAHVASETTEGNYLLTVDAHEVPGLSSGTFSATGAIKQAWTPQGWFDPKQINGGAKVNANFLALASILQVIAPQAAWAKQLPGLVGETIALDGKFAWSPNDGRLQAKINGSQGRIELDGSWENGFIVFHQPLIVEAKLTKQLIDEVLVDIAPILSSTIPSDQPIRFEIDSRQTRIPLSGDTLKQLKLSKGRLELGKVQFRSDGQIGQVSALLRGESALSNGSFPVTFTPLVFSVDNGVVSIQRVDALVAERYPIAMWGTVDVARDKVNLIIGISAQALKEAYGIAIADDRYVLQLPLRGTLTNASIDKIKATARITSLVAQSQGGPNGLILGGVLDLIGGGDDRNTPPPAEPLPWARNEASKPKANSDDVASQQEPTQKKTSIKKKIQNHLQKGASRLLDILK